MYRGWRLARDGNEEEATQNGVEEEEEDEEGKGEGTAKKAWVMAVFQDGDAKLRAEHPNTTTTTQQHTPQTTIPTL